MPKETRKLVFSAQEVETAIGVYLDASKIPARSTHILSVALQRGEEVGALLRLSIALPGAKDELLLGTEQIGAALILYCKKTRVPLPKGGTKSLQRDGPGIAMEITLD